MSLANWIASGTFTAQVLVIALYGLAASGHFPAELRNAEFKTLSGAAVLWLTMAATVAAAGAAAWFAWHQVPWYAAVIGGGAALLVAPMILQTFPDSFVDGRAGLIAPSIGSVVLAAASTTST